MDGNIGGWSFTSLTFWPFLGLVLVAYWLAPSRCRNGVLLIGSYVFYASWDWRFLAVLLVPTVSDFSVARAIAKSDDARRRRGLLGLSLLIDLGVLGFFKYNDFFIAQIARALERWGLGFSGPAPRIFVPIGISFFTLSSLSYVFDVYRRKMEPTRRLPDYALFVAFFPKLIAGPIERARTFLPQIAGERRVGWSDLREGGWFVLQGLFAKLVVADGMAQLVNGIYAADPALLSGLECWTGAYAYAFQLYCDFWGYSAIALGISRWLGFRLMLNFRTPYFSRNPSEFWSRWHISLSSWLRDYVFLPLDYLMLRRQGVRTWLGLREDYWAYFGSVFATMLVAGLWHGTGWTFMVWGAYFGLLLCFHRAFLGYRKLLGLSRSRLRRISGPVRTLALFNLVCVGWVIFRAGSVGQAATMLTKMLTDFRMTSVVTYGLGLMGILAGPFLFLEYALSRRDEGTGLPRFSWAMRGAIYAYMVLMIIVFSAVRQNEFIYFRF